ncbi:hypothetical protein [Streptomyces ardesiacus]|uniref:hypothetical protein n=1 Tax=Streptomyces ardesiacus TaxID=285564 RepID=UPI0036A2D490
MSHIEDRDTADEGEAAVAEQVQVFRGRDLLDDGLAPAPPQPSAPGDGDGRRPVFRPPCATPGAEQGVQYPVDVRLLAGRYGDHRTHGSLGHHDALAIDEQRDEQRAQDGCAEGQSVVAGESSASCPHDDPRHDPGKNPYGVGAPPSDRRVGRRVRHVQGRAVHRDHAGTGHGRSARCHSLEGRSDKTAPDVPAANCTPDDASDQAR